MIPNRVVTFTNLGDRPEPFRLWQYLCLRSMKAALAPDDILLLGGEEPEGEWWQRARRFVRFEQTRPVTSIYGNPLKHHAHRTDVMRLQWLYENGGIYLDLDTICVKPHGSLLDAKCVMGKEDGVGLCNAVILCEKGHPFLKAWLEEFRTFKGGWNSHACVAPWKVYQDPKITPFVTALPMSAFFIPDCTGPAIKAMHVGDNQYPDAYSHHLWHTKAAKWLDAYTPETIETGTSTFCRLTRPLLPCRNFRS